MGNRSPLPTRLARLRVITRLGIVVTSGLLLLLLFRPMSPGWLRPVAVGVVLGLALLELWEWRRRERRLKDLIAADWRRCPYCFFDLTGLNDHGTCPECGEQYIAGEVREQWQTFVSAEHEDARRDD